MFVKLNLRYIPYKYNKIVAQSFVKFYAKVLLSPNKVVHLHRKICHTNNL